MKQKMIVVAALAGTLVLGLTAWLTVNTFRELDAGLKEQKRRAQTLEWELAQRTRSLDDTRRLAETARDEAAKAAQLADRRSSEVEQAQQHAVQAEQERSAAEQMTLAATARETESREALQGMIERRQRELQRMQEALSKIAPTHRTASGMVIELVNDSFHFDFDKAALRPENREVLSRIAGVLLASDGYRLFVDGHTDDVGPAAYNKELSNRRAQTVADYLREAGVPPEAIEVRGFGKTNPRATSQTQEARQKNRRVEIGIVDSVIQVQQAAPAG